MAAGTHRLELTLDPSLHQRLRAHARQHGISEETVLRQALERMLDATAPEEFLTDADEPETLI